MAIKYSEMNRRDKKPLDEVEAQWVKDVENYVDSQILDQFRTQSFVRIPVDIISFDFDPINQVQRKVKKIRKLVMRKEIERMYHDANWKFSTEASDPLTENSTYWVLTGKTI